MARTTDDLRRSRFDRLGRAVMLPLLALATVVSLLGSPWRTVPVRVEVGLVLVGVTAVWTAAVTMRRPGVHGARGIVVFAVHTALAAALVGVSPWFGLFAWSGYAIAGDWLGPRAIRPGLAATAVVLAASQAGGYPTTSAAWVVFGVLLAINVTLAFALTAGAERILTRNEELGEANARLEAALAENAGLHAQLVEQAREAGIDDERRRLAGEIHDTLAQGLAGIVTQLEAADGAPDAATARAHLDRARALARESLTEARRSVRALRPEQLERATLAQAVAEHAQGWTASCGVAAQVETTGVERRLPQEVEAALFRVAQEGLTNVAKHARASKVWLTLTYLEDVVVLDVRDDGAGFRAPTGVLGGGVPSGGAPSGGGPGGGAPGGGAAGGAVGGGVPGSGGPGGVAGGYGLDGMRQRLARVGGTLEVETAPGEGTALSAAVPL